MGFPGSSDGKESACNVGDLGSVSGLGRSPGGGYDNPLQYSCLENLLKLVGYSPWGCKDSDMTDRLSTKHIGGFNNHYNFRVVMSMIIFWDIYNNCNVIWEYLICIDDKVIAAIDIASVCCLHYNEKALLHFSETLAEIKCNCFFFWTNRIEILSNCSNSLKFQLKFKNMHNWLSGWIYSNSSKRQVCWGYQLLWAFSGG